MRLTTVFQGAAFVALCAAAASAQDRAARWIERDLNRDGVMTEGEYTSTGGHPGNFRALDTNNDGVLSRNEFVNRRAGIEDDVAPDAGRVDPNTRVGSIAAGNQFRAKDRNGDGFLTRGEYGDAVTFDRVDRNDDNRISYDEFLNPAPATTREERFHQLDRNRDAVLERGEWAADAGVFHLADRNGDGVVTVREFVNAPAGESYEQRFEELDRDHDGVIERREWPSGETTTFDRADRNNDGVVTRWEFRNSGATTANPGEMVFDDMDHNNDGIISRFEWHADRASFDRIDRNNDGVITIAEFGSPLAEDTRSARFRVLDRNNDRQISRTEWLADRESFAILDRNRNAALTLAEYLDTRALLERFGWLDDNRDGILDRREWSGTAATLRVLDRNRDGRVTRDEFVN
jgi:Ca2+-binding EF-hand superfamily protein